MMARIVPVLMLVACVTTIKAPPAIAFDPPLGSTLTPSQGQKAAATRAQIRDLRARAEGGQIELIDWYTDLHLVLTAYFGHPLPAEIEQAMHAIYDVALRAMLAEKVNALFRPAAFGIWDNIKPVDPRAVALLAGK